jgi:O-antigen/teichoic acid export membrane protein
VSVKRSIFFTFLVQIPALLFGVVAGVFLTRTIGAAGTGTLGVFQADIDFFVLVLSLSLTNAFIYFIPGNKLPLNELLSLGVWIVCGGVAALAGIIALAHVFDGETLLYTPGFTQLKYDLFLVGGFLVSVFNSFAIAILQGFKNFRRVNQVTLINSLLNLGSFGGMFAAKKAGLFNPDFDTILLITFAILCVNALLWVYHLSKVLPPGFRLTTTFSPQTRAIGRFVIIAYLSNVFNFLNYRFDIWVINYYCKAEELGYYLKAVNLAQMLWLISNPLATVLAPHLSETDDSAKTKDFVAQLSRLNVTVVLGAAAVMFLLADFVFPFLYGPDFSNAVFPFKVIVAGIVFTCITKIFATYIFSRGKVIYNLWATIVALAATIVLDLLLIPHLGILGACITSVVAYFLVLLVVFYFLFRKFGFRWRNYFFVQPADITRLKLIFKGNKQEQQ